MFRLVTCFFYFLIESKKVGSEITKLFGHNKQSSTSSATTSASTSNPVKQGLLARAANLCTQLKSRKSVRGRKVHSIKEVQKGLVLIDFQEEKSDIPLREYDKLYDGSMRYSSDMSERDIRNEIVRLVKQKKTATHNLQFMQPEDFNFVRCVNRHVMVIHLSTLVELVRFTKMVLYMFDLILVYLWINLKE